MRNEPNHAEGREQARSADGLFARMRWEPPPSWLFAASVFTSAFLLFSIQPLIVKDALPAFGGSAALWLTSLVVFQTLLLFGYAYAHLVRDWSARSFATMHLLVLFSSLAFLPPRFRSTEVLDALASSHPKGAVLGTLTLSIGLVFFVLASNTTLVHRWLASSGNRDPYYLYAISNAGSLAGLCSYPVLIEVHLGLARQAAGWTAGYGFFAVVTAVLVLATLRKRPGGEPASESVAVSHTSVRIRPLWILAPATATALLVGTTLWLTTEADTGPLFWAVPLAIYLVTFIIAFATRPVVSERVVWWGSVVSIAVAMMAFTAPGTFPPLATIAIMLAALFFGATLCHTRLAEARPPVSHLSHFYLMIAAGGVLGSALSALVAPALFNRVGEYPIALAVVAWFASPPIERAERGRYLRSPAVVLVMLILGAALVALAVMPAGVETAIPVGIVFSLVVLGAVLARHPWQLGAAMTTVAIVILFGWQEGPSTESLRSFYGVSRITTRESQRLLTHGLTIHGMQWQDPRHRRVATTYYHPEGPLGRVVQRAGPSERIGIVGLGAGTLATLTKPGQTMTFFEIDPLIVEIARTRFTFLADAPARIEVVVADGRKAIERLDDGSLDLLIIDAFGSDSIPTHLVTEEALEEALRVVGPRGLVALHVSNRNADLLPVFRGSLRGLPAMVSRYEPSEAAERQGAHATVAVAVSRSTERLEELAATGIFRPLDRDGKSVRWTDDRSNLFQILRWRD